MMGLLRICLLLALAPVPIRAWSNHEILSVRPSDASRFGAKLSQRRRETVQLKAAASSDPSIRQDPPPQPTTKRRRKKNKYEKYSKVQSDTDPFEDLLAESKQKLQELEDEREHRRQAALPQKPKTLHNVPKPSFPADTRSIDPYDPTTFGYTEIGHVTGAHGVQGWLKVRSTTDFPHERLCTGPALRHLKPARKRAPRQVVLLQGKPRLEDEYLIQLEGVTDRESALQLRGSTLYVRQEDRVLSPSVAEEDDDEYIVSDLVGLEVRMADATKRFVGLVQGLVLAEDMCAVPGLGHDTLEVVLQEGPLPSFRDELVLIPLVKQIVPKVDLQNGFLLIDPPAGLLDLTFVRSERVRIKGFLPSNDDVATEEEQ